MIKRIKNKKIKSFGTFFSILKKMAFLDIFSSTAIFQPIHTQNCLK